MIEVKNYQVEQAERMLSHIPNGTQKALMHGLNKAIAGVKTDAVKQITSIYTIKAGTVREAINIKKATNNNLTAAIKSDGAVIPLSKFKVSTLRPEGNRKAKPIVHATVKHGESKPIKHSFTASMRSSHKGVFTRSGKSRLPIREMFSLSIPQMLGNKNVQQYLTDNARDRLDKAIEHEISRLLQGVGK